MSKRTKQALGENTSLSLAGATIVMPGRCHETIRLAAGELARYLYLMTGRLSPTTHVLPQTGPAIVLGGPVARALGVTVTRQVTGDQGFRLAVADADPVQAVVVAAATPVGFLYGAYELLEMLGMGFHAGGDTFPDRPTEARIPTALHTCRRPAFAVRGNMLHYNFLSGCTNWGLEDYKFYFDQLSRMRCNMLLMHWYDGEPGAAYEVDGEYLAGGVTPNSLTKPWGALASLRTSEFAFGSGRHFTGEIYSSPMGEDAPDLISEIKESERVFSEATRYARTAGVQVAAGFEAPRGDPTDSLTRTRFTARLRQFLARNPHLTHFALWQHESGACVGLPPPAPDTPAAELLEERRPPFAHLGVDNRVWAAICYGEYAALAHEILHKEAPHLRLVMVGWGGDRWMRFSDLCVGYERTLPRDIIFTCHDNIDASFGPTVSSGWGKLPRDRERWAMPWVEGDIDECWSRQPHVESLGKLAPDALAKGAQGLLTLQWRTRDVEEETGFIARFAWNTGLTPDLYYHDLARRAFGPDHEKDMGKLLGTLQRLGARWTGVRGTVECSGMRWTGNIPHYPFDLDASVPGYLRPMAEAAWDSLAIVPTESTDPTAGAFHLRPEEGDTTALPRDLSRPGVKVLAKVVEQLSALAGEQEENALREALITIEESLWAVRPGLIAYGMTSPSYRALDSLLIAVHHLQRNAGATRKLPQLRALRRQLDLLRKHYVKAGRVERLERLDYLASTMDFLLHYDAVAMLMADGERVDQALAAADAAQLTGDGAAAADIASKAYAEVVDSGMEHAVRALGEKLTTRCDYGVLTTFNVKALPLYWKTLGNLERFLPAVPPRQLAARGRDTEAWVSWVCSERGMGHHVYRRKAGVHKWSRITRHPLGGACGLFVDHTVRGAGTYEYAVTALADGNWESPRSHTALAHVGTRDVSPRIRGCRPPSRVAPDEALPIRVTAQSDADLASVAIRYRDMGDPEWGTAPLVHAFRDAYAGPLPAAAETGAREFYVEAIDEHGNRSVWPAAAAVGLPWSLTVLAAAGAGRQ